MKRLAFLTIVLSLLNLTTMTAQENRLIQHAMGETVVPAHPKRIVVLDGGALDSVVILGFMPVGAVNVFSSGIIPNYLKAFYKGPVTTQSVGTLAEPSLEQILLLKPDLILSTIGRSKKIYHQLSAIGPTVLAGTEGGYRWREYFKLYAKALDEEEKANELLAQYDREVSALRKALAKKGKLPSVSVIRFFLEQTRLYPAKTFIGTIISDLGLPRPVEQAQLQDKQVVGPEAIPGMDADFLFYTFLSDPMGAGRDSPDHYPAFFKSPLWLKLKANRTHHIFEVPDEYWMRGTGVGAALLVIKDLNKYLIGK